MARGKDAKQQISVHVISLALKLVLFLAFLKLQIFISGSETIFLLYFQKYAMLFSKYFILLLT